MLSNHHCRKFDESSIGWYIGVTQKNFYSAYEYRYTFLWLTLVDSASHTVWPPGVVVVCLRAQHVHAWRKKHTLIKRLNHLNMKLNVLSPHWNFHFRVHLVGYEYQAKERHVTPTCPDRWYTHSGQHVLDVQERMLHLPVQTDGILVADNMSWMRRDCCYTYLSRQMVYS